MTKEERHLWYDFLKKLPITVNLQKVIGKYIVDFYCAKSKIVIELDGSQHYEEKGKESDIIRDLYLNNLEISVLRYSNVDVNRNFEGVCRDIFLHLIRHLRYQLPLEGKPKKKVALKGQLFSVTFMHNRKTVLMFFRYSVKPEFINLANFSFNSILFSLLFTVF